jgi:hypothetical protein
VCLYPECSLSVLADDGKEQFCVPISKLLFLRIVENMQQVSLQNCGEAGMIPAQTNKLKLN